MAEEPKPIERLVAKNYGCLKNVDIELTKLHALIGPNDSGKSTLLRCIRILEQLASSSFTDVSEQDSKPFFHGLDFTREFELAVFFADGLGYSIATNPEALHVNEIPLHNGNELTTIIRPLTKNGELVREPKRTEYTALLKRMSGARLVRFDPDKLREPSSLIPDNREILLRDERGMGLPGVYDAIMNRDVEAFLSIQKDTQKLFPPVRRLQLRAITQSAKTLKVELHTGEEIDASLMSEGLLFYLAFAAIPHLAPTSVLLVEEPENGLHPARIQDIVGILREVSKKTQVIIATHSPLVVNELKPEEVSVVTRTVDEGTIVTPIKETPNFETRSKAYALGELWLSYCDGEMEAPLLNGQPRP